MGNYLTASYNLKIKRMYEIAKEKIEGKLDVEFSDNKKILLKFVLNYVREAYREGVNFASVDAKARTGRYIKVDYKINSNTKSRLLKEFILRIGMAERVYKTKMENYRDLASLKKIKVNEKGSQEKQIIKEYFNGINAAINILLINSGREGQAKIYKQL